MGLDNPLHIAFLVVILLLVFGARRLPEIGRSLGAGMREFKESVTGESKSQSPTLNAGGQPAQPPQPPQPAAQAPAPQPVATPAPQEGAPAPATPAEPQSNPFGH
jgi:sec-independent protein translocase protein TatA